MRSNFNGLPLTTVPCFIKEVPRTRFKLRMNRPSCLSKNILTAARPKTGPLPFSGKKIALGIVTWVSSTGTSVMVPLLAMATLELEVPKSIPQEIFVMTYMLSNPGKSKIGAQTYYFARLSQ
jgi:hypothetical protein